MMDKRFCGNRRFDDYRAGWLAAWDALSYWSSGHVRQAYGRRAGLAQRTCWERYRRQLKQADALQASRTMRWRLGTITVANDNKPWLNVPDAECRERAPADRAEDEELGDGWD